VALLGEIGLEFKQDEFVKGDEMEKVSENTLVPIGAMAGVFMTLAGGIWWASAMYVRVAQAETSIVALQNNHAEIVRELKEVNGNLIELKKVIKNGK